MRYYLLEEESEMIIDLARVEKIDFQNFRFEYNYIKDQKVVDSKTMYVRRMADKVYGSFDNVKWEKISRQNVPTSLLNVNKVYDLYRGYKPSGLGADNSGALITQMPGKVVKLRVEVGEEVKKGQTLLVLEAMKMENEIKSGIDGKIKAIYIEEGQALEQGFLMMEIE